eukprot:m.183896 g.183896  ORF g.183896 m.183896 type:complete len:910 (+) comp16660_c0_seq15:210-2939(+)
MTYGCAASLPTTSKETTALAKPTALTRLSHWIDETVSEAYYRLGSSIAEQPCLYVIIPTIVMLAFATRLFAAAVIPEEDPEDLYTPQNSIAFAQRIVVEDAFGINPTTNFFYLQADNLLSSDNTNEQNQAALLSFLTLYTTLTSVTYQAADEHVSYESRCNTTGTGCVEYSVLNFFDYNETRILEDNDVMATINNGLQAAYNAGQPLLGRAQLFGGFTSADASVVEITGAQAFSHRFELINRERRVNGNLQLDNNRLEWEIRDAQALRRTIIDVGRVYVLFDGDFGNEISKAIAVDVVLLPLGYLLLILYSAFVLWRRNPIYSYASMAFVSIAGIGLAIVGMWGFGLIVGVEYALVVQGSFFLLLGLGVDDTFVIMGAHRLVDRSLSPKERIAQTLARAGMSITITSVTDIVAFAAGTITSLPSIRIFCLFTMIGVIFDFMLQVTFVISFLFWNTVREHVGRADCFCWLRPARETNPCSQEKFNPDEQSSLDIIVGTWLPKRLLHPVGKSIVLITTLALAASSIWAATNVTSRFNINWFVPSSSHVQDAIRVQNQFFGGRADRFGAFTGPTLLGYPDIATQASLQQLSERLLASRYVRQCPGNWWTAFLQSTQERFPSNMTMDGWIEPVVFYERLDDFLATQDGALFRSSMVRDSQGAISIAEITCEFVDVFGQNTQVESMRDVRAIVASFEELGGAAISTARGEAVFPFAYAYPFLFNDGQAVIRQETLRNVLIAGITVTIMTTLLLANIHASIIVVVMLAFVDINVLGFMYYVGLDFNSVSATNLVIAVGLAIDSSVHVAHAFLSAQGTRDERAAEALKALGRPVTHGAFSTFLALVLLAFAQSYIFQVLFKLLSLILFFAYFHGILVLPVVLSMIGPDPYPAKKQPQDNQSILEEPEKSVTSVISL